MTVVVLERCVLKKKAVGEDQPQTEWVSVRPKFDCDECLERLRPKPVLRVMKDAADSIEDWLEFRGVNTRKHGRASLDNFDASHAKHAPELARQFIEAALLADRHERVRGLYIVGNPGTGKSHLAVAIMRQFRGKVPDLFGSDPVMFEPADRLVTRVQDSYGSGTTDSLISERARARLYVLDDLGREKATADALRVLCTILDEREGSPTIITSNMLPSELGEHHGHAEDRMWSRVASRLGDDVYDYVLVDGPDRRFAANG